MEHRQIATNGIHLHVASIGTGRPILLLHGWPHTWQIWSRLIPELAGDHYLIAPDLRGLGDSERPDSGYDAETISNDLIGILTTLTDQPATVVALDAAVPAAFLLGARHPELIHRLVLMEALLPGLTGAEQVPTPWWFGFHAILGLAESVVDGHESRYLDWFLSNGTFAGRGVPEPIRAAFVAAYTGHAALRAGFEYYRVAERNAHLLATSGRLTVPTLAIGGNSVGEVLARQLSPVTDQLTAELFAECGHLVPIDQPRLLADRIRQFSAQ